MSGESARLIVAILGMIPWWLAVAAARRAPVVADGTTGEPLANASVFDCRGRFIGTTRSDGAVMCASQADYPVTIRFMGFYERSVAHEAADTVFMMENVAELPEVVVESKEHRMLHMLAYVREYSTLASCSDTVAMFREKMVDFMLPADDRTRYKGWRYPRTINAKSYYHFSDSNGLDSVSDRCNQHFTWSDWIGMLPPVRIPPALAGAENATDTLHGKYSPVEIWSRSGGHRLSVDINVMADTAGRRWVPGISAFSRTRPIDFERFTMRLNYNGVDGPVVTPLDLTGYSFNIESRGRGDGIFLFNRPSEPKFVTTYAEVYLVDKEYITVKEARKWESRKFDTESLEIIEPPEAPDLSPAIAALVDRVSNIDTDYVRSGITPDSRMKSRRVVRQNFGHRALSLLKTLTGISRIRSNRRTNRQWRDFRARQVKANNSRPFPLDSTIENRCDRPVETGSQPESGQ